MEFDKKLFLAVKRGSIAEFRACITQDSDVNASNEDGEKLIHVAAQLGRQNIIDELIIRHGVDVNDLDAQGCTPLYHAAKCGRTNTLIRLADKYCADVNKANKEGVSPVHVAASKGCLGIVKFLIEKKEVSPNYADENRWTPLHFAAGGRNCLKTVMFLVEKGAITNIENASGRAPIHIAAINGCDNNIEFLLAKGVDVNDVDREGHTALYHAAWNGWGRTMSFLLERGAVGIDVSGRDLKPLYNALEEDYLEIVEFFVGGGRVRVDDYDARHRTLLYRIVERGNLEVAKLIINRSNNTNEKVDDTDEIVKIARYLLDEGADIGYQDDNGETPLSIAIKFRNMQSSSLMDCSATKSPPYNSQDIADKISDLELGLNDLTVSGANETNRDSQTLSHFSTEESSLAVGGAFFNSRTSLKSDGRVNNTSTSAGSSTPASTSGFTSDSNISEGDKITNSSSKPSSAFGGARQKELVQPLSTSMPDNSETQNSIYVSLGNAVKSGTVKKVQSLIGECQDINKTYEKGNTLLHFAIERVHVSIFRVLMKNGANHSSCNEEGDTPLHFVGRSNKLKLVKQLNDMAKELIKGGADPDFCNKEGDTPLHLAVKGGLLPVVETLLENGATVNVKNKAKERPLDLVGTGPNSKGIKDLLLKFCKKQFKPTSTFFERERERRSIQSGGLQPPTHEASRS
ncbi:hypothetical protein NPIL_366201, partial [Nephila pilipes]